MVNLDRLQAAYETARSDLLTQRTARGPWVGELCSSPLSTATAVSALVLAEQHGRRRTSEYVPENVYQGDLSELIVQSLHWLAEQQNEDGGWGDTDKSCSNIATTMLVHAAFHLTGVPAKYADLLERTRSYIESQGGVAGLKQRYGSDKTFAAPILANCALADLVSWRDVSPLPFEIACLPQSVYRFLRLPVVSYAIPALVAIGQARFFHSKPVNPLSRLIRTMATGPSRRVLEQIQPASGGFLEATPLTSFVIMSMASVGQADSPVVRRGIEFLLTSVRPDGSWPIDSNLVVWNTTMAIGALANSGEDVHRLECLDWLLSCQFQEPNPFTGAVPGGWAWTDSSGGVPDADDTSAALLALMAHRSKANLEQRARIDQSARAGVLWLLELQNHDGGWPTFCRGWGRLPFDRSGSDLTAHAIRAIHAWHSMLREDRDEERRVAPIQDRIDQALRRGLHFLQNQQRSDGSWLPLWFGNQHLPNEENPIYGTARVLLAYRDLGQIDSPQARAGLAYLVSCQQPGGGWGGGPAAAENGYPSQSSTVEETSLAVEALLGAGAERSLQDAIEQGVAFLIQCVEEGRHGQSAPIGFYFAKLWYHERLYPVVRIVAALGQALVWARRSSGSDSIPAAHASST